MESDEARIVRLELEKIELVKAIIGLLTSFGPDPENQAEARSYENAIVLVERLTGKTFVDVLEGLP